METCPWRGGDKSITHTHTHTHICKHAGSRSPADHGEDAHDVEVINQSHTHTRTHTHTHICKHAGTRSPADHGEHAHGMGGDESITHTHICKNAGTRSPADNGEHAHGMEVINQSHTHTHLQKRRYQITS